MDSLLLSSSTKEGSLHNYKECHFFLVPIRLQKSYSPPFTSLVNLMNEDAGPGLFAVSNRTIQRKFGEILGIIEYHG